MANEANSASARQSASGDDGEVWADADAGGSGQDPQGSRHADGSAVSASASTSASSSGTDTDSDSDSDSNQFFDTAPFAAPALHKAVVTGDSEQLVALLESVAVAHRYHDKHTHVINAHDSHGMTALHLATLLADQKAIDALIDAGASVTLPSAELYATYHEAIATSNAALLLRALKIIRATSQVVYETKLPNVLATLASLDDFALDLDWKVSSWVPFVSRLCPTDTYKVYKIGEAVRVDITLIGREGSSWIRGNISFVFLPTPPLGVLYSINHETKTYSVIKTDAVAMSDSQLAREAAHLMRSEIAVTDVPLENIEVAPATSWMGSLRFEEVNGYPCSVHNMSNIVVSTKTRNEHISPEIRAELEARRRRLAELEEVALEAENPDTLELEASETDALLDDLQRKYGSKLASSLPTYHPVARDEPDALWAAYLAHGPAVLRGRELSEQTSTKTLKASLWCSPDFPLTIDQFRPLLHLLAPASPEFKEISEFFDNRLPHDHGFPVRFQLPLYKLFKAEATFRNYRLLDASDPDVIALIALPADYTQVASLADFDEADYSYESSQLSIHRGR
ncbi:ankyrin repeat domain-containing protein 13C-B [Thecamonas trahens ATCC 50062]|uniref:Ankyrin repeat domain-containing protein 13C-B n=1 Tax=Thecamonas trahens ATCC 50062 TaxID=461836 RepID=A0A0L0D815_THETB|nr:ankyrin repeat domain-containing protein 13C-B [Thecamonas trahens ATCC 50062]KNC48522.1 ankyrin repeat domain-containing protein 13C-B [Thecamonas trahens ATCC 50062]|eukprot:XP_013758630.1 ankyrin repeat domain-containing protein 13C-B [Thecamonas trahens ATCC 50062]